MLLTEKAETPTTRRKDYALQGEMDAALARIVALEAGGGGGGGLTLFDDLDGGDSSTVFDIVIDGGTS